MAFGTGKGGKGQEVTNKGELWKEEDDGKGESKGRGCI